MGKITYHKLVRDKIPEIIKASGKVCKTEILSDSEKAGEPDFSDYQPSLISMNITSWKTLSMMRYRQDLCMTVSYLQFVDVVHSVSSGIR